MRNQLHENGNGWFRAGYLQGEFFGTSPVADIERQNTEAANRRGEQAHSSDNRGTVWWSWHRCEYAYSVVAALHGAGLVSRNRNPRVIEATRTLSARVAVFVTIRRRIPTDCRPAVCTAFSLLVSLQLGGEIFINNHLPRWMHWSLCNAPREIDQAEVWCGIAPRMGGNHRRAVLHGTTKPTSQR